MTGETEQKILEAALNLFAEKGYTGATTRVIAEEAGVSELTLFRKFKTKKNLFDTIISQNLEKMKKDLESILINKKFNSNGEFLETFIRNYVESVEKNFEVFFLVINDGTGEFEQSLSEFFRESAEYIEKNIGNSNIDPEAFALTIAGFTYIICIEKHKGRTIFNQEEVMENFINNSIKCIQ
jgi:TetR/AcrR family transcriptional regulator